MPRTDIEPMAVRLDDCPWQQLPEMAESYHAERAGIEAGLMLVEAFHHHHARRLEHKNRQAALLRLGAAIATAKLRADIVGVMK